MKPCLSLLYLASACLFATHALGAPAAGDTLVINQADSTFLIHSGDTVSSGPKVIKYSNGQTFAEGTLQYWSREGWWKIYREDGSKTSEVNFVDGKGTDMRTFDEHGNATGTFTTVEKEAAFPGGDAAWNNYIRAAIMDKIDYLSRKKAWGNIEIQFIVEKNGSLSNVEVIKKSGTVLDDVVADIFKKSPAWNPAIQYNRPVKAYRRQHFSLQAPK
jgi:hypothetical protein